MDQALKQRERGFLFYPLMRVVLTSLIQSQRPENLSKRVLIRVVFVAGADGDHVEQLAVTQLCGYHIYDLALAGRFVDVVQRQQQTISPVDINALVTAV